MRDDTAIVDANPACSERTSVKDAHHEAPQVDLAALYRDSGIGDVLGELDRDLVGLAPVKTRIREVAAHLLVERARDSLGLAGGAPTLHMCFSGNPGTGKTTVALRMAEVLHRLGYIRRNHLVSVTRDDLVGQYIGHTAPKTRDVLKRAMGGVLFIDEAYYLYRPENERDYGQEAIEILLQTMENQRSDLVVILAGYASRMEVFFESNPGFRSRIAHHITFPDYAEAELLDIAERMLGTMHYRFDAASRHAFADYLARRIRQPNFANARSVRNALDRARLRQANRLFATALQGGAPIDAAALTLIAAADVRASRVFDEPPPSPPTSRAATAPSG
jgi:probable Rubsico expression protein CbbX